MSKTFEEKLIEAYARGSMEDLKAIVSAPEGWYSFFTDGHKNLWGNHPEIINVCVPLIEGRIEKLHRLKKYWIRDTVRAFRDRLLWFIPTIPALKVVLDELDSLILYEKVQYISSSDKPHWAPDRLSPRIYLAYSDEFNFKVFP